MLLGSHHAVGTGRRFFIGGFLGLMVSAAVARVLEVDQRGGAPHKTIMEAVEVAGAGDTIHVAPGSGPYRESVLLKKSGDPGNPIILDGSNELITGFEPLKGFREEGGKWICEVPIISTRIEKSPESPFPCVITYQGVRLVVDPVTKQFTRFARMSDDKKRLELLSDTKPEGWEIATRGAVVSILKASHLIIRNVRASGSTNDGFNIHSTCENLVFENIEGFQNFDEGFSSHDVSETEIRKGRFWGNDNGIWNASRSTIKFKASNVEIFSNLGWGLWTQRGETVLDNVKVWDNGVGQVQLGGKMSCTGLVTYESRWGGNRPWESYQETKGNKPSKEALNIASDCIFEGDRPTVHATDELPPLKEP